MAGLLKFRTLFAIGGVMLLTLAISSCTTVRTYIDWGLFMSPFTSGQETGVNPAISSCGLFSHRVVEVRQNGSNLGPLSYRVGEESGGNTINWQGSLPYQTGLNPAVACADNTVVRVRQTVNGPGPLLLTAGEFDSAGVNILPYGDSDSIVVPRGMNPAVAISGGLVVVVYQEGPDPGALWYRLGYIKRIRDQFDPPGSAYMVWQPPVRFGGQVHKQLLSLQGVHGLNPAVAMRFGRVIVVFQTVAGVGPLWSLIGRINSNLEIEWAGSPIQYEESGLSPAIASITNVSVTEVHQEAVGLGRLWSVVGGIPTGAGSITWGTPQKYADSGLAPSVALTSYDPVPPNTIGGQNVIAVHQKGPSVGPFEYIIGRRVLFQF